MAMSLSIVIAFVSGFQTEAGWR